MAFGTLWNRTSDLLSFSSSTSLPYDVTTINETGTHHVISAEDKERIVAICIIMACTLIGNLVLILALLCRRSKRVRRVNIFLINLAFGDLAVAMFVNSTEILFIAFGDWVLGPVMCKVIVYVQMVCLASATNLLTAMSLDRYQVIVKPMESLRERPRVLLKIAVAWALSLVFPIPQLFIFVQYNNGLKPDGTARRSCGSRGYTSSWQRKAYFTFTTSYILIIPMAIMVYCYMKIIHVVWVRASMTALQFKSSQRRHSQGQSYQNNHSHGHFSPGRTNNTAASTARSPTTASAATRSANSPMVKTSVCHSTGTGQSTSCVAKGAVDYERKRGLLNSPRFVGRPGQIHVKWASSDKTRRNCDSAGNSQNDLDQSSSGAGLVEKKGVKKYGSTRVSVRRNLMASKRRALFMTLSVVVSFLVCLTPYFFLSLLRIYSDYQLKMETAKVISEFMVMIHSTLNPLLYGLFSLRKHHLKYVLPLLFCSKANGRSIETREAKEMQSIGRRKGKSRRNCGSKASSSKRLFRKDLGGSTNSASSTCVTSSSSASTLCKQYRDGFSHNQTKDGCLFQAANAAGNQRSDSDASHFSRSDDNALLCTTKKNLRSNNSNHYPTKNFQELNSFRHDVEILPQNLNSSAKDSSSLDDTGALTEVPTDERPASAGFSERGDIAVHSLENR